MNQRLSRRHFLGALGAVGTPYGRLPACNASETYTMRFAIGSAANSLNVRAMLRFAAAVNRRSGGQLKIEVYPNGQLAKEAEMIDALTTGVIDLAVQATSFLVPLLPSFQIFDTPFLFKDLAAGFRVLDGPIGAEFFADLDAKGIVGLGWGTGGFKEIDTTTKAIVVPDDMRGIRMRIPGGGVYVAIYQALGAIPVTIDIAETFTALSQHVIDAIDNNLDIVTTGKYYAVIKHVAMSNHIFSVVPLMASKRKFEALPVALQKLAKEEGTAIVPYWRSLTTRQIAEDTQILKQNGVTFTEVQYPLFRKAMDPVYAAIQSRLGGDLLDRVGRATNVAAGIKR
jgi:TRAP-type transport system periplasmic protein